MDSPDSADSVSRTLREWRVAPSRNPQFCAEVWARLGRSDRAALSWSAYARQHAPAIAGALALAVVVGAIGGRERARSRVAAESAQLAAAYVQALDARSMAMP